MGDRARAVRISRVRPLSPCYCSSMGVDDLDPTVCYEAVRSRDSRFDGRFFVGVRTTGVYCRPSCHSRTPRSENVHFFRTGADARAAGFRACRRCHPELLDPGAEPGAAVTPGAVEEVASGAGAVDWLRAETLARRLNWSPRHLQRLLGSEAGLTPHQLIRFLRLHAAIKRLPTALGSLTEIAAEAGFPSLRAFEHDAKTAFGGPPGVLRIEGRVDPARLFWGPGLRLLLPYRGPFDVAQLLRFLGVRAVPGLEEGDADGRFFRRAIRLSGGLGIVAVEPPPDARPGRLPVTLHLEMASDLPEAVATLRALFDLDGDTDAVARALGSHPVLGPVVRRCPGIRVPGHVDGAEMAVRAILGQQISVEAARTQTSRLVRLYGKPLPYPTGSIGFLFPAPEDLAGAGPELPGMAMPASRRRTIHGLAEAVLRHRLPALVRGADPDLVGTALQALYGIGPWTRSYIAMRALGDPDAFLAGDLGVRQGYQALTGERPEARVLESLSEAWRPFRAYAVVQLWNVLTERAWHAPILLEESAR